MVKPTDDRLDDPLTLLERARVGNACRVTFPLASRAYMLHVVVPALRQLARDLEVHCEIGSAPEVSALFLSGNEFSRINSYLKEQAKQWGFEVREGRRKNADIGPREGEQNTNKGESGRPVSRPTALQVVPRRRS